jgi:hypothetical protein
MFESPEAVAPAFVVFESWAPRTLTQCSFVTAKCQAAMLHRMRAQSTPSLLRRRILTLYYYQLLSAVASVRDCWKPGCVSARARASEAAVLVRSRRIRSHAGARSSVDERARAGKSIGSNAGDQAGLCAAAAWAAAHRGRRAPTFAVEWANRARPNLAASIL